MTEREKIEWFRQPDAANHVSVLLGELVSAMPAAQSLARNLLERTGSRLVDWIDHLVVADGGPARGRLADLGFEQEEVPARSGDSVFYHPGAILPRLVLRSGARGRPGAAIAAAILVEDINLFLMTHHLTAPVEGSPLSPFRQARAWEVAGHELLVVERRGNPGFVPTQMPPDYADRYLRCFEQWATRPRQPEDSQQGMMETLHLAQSLVAEMGVDAAAWIAFEAERAHWQRRTRAGQIQKARQDRLGLGWANQDHQAFRSSRNVFPMLIQILETFGFRPRERFYAGAEAGWGAQVMEQPVCRLGMFADVDLSPGEVEGDFAHRPLPDRHELGTVGLWCALHGESMLGAGLHHLAGRFDFDAVTTDLEEWDVKMMRPFSDFSYLRQAFTRGERWEVSQDRLDNLVENGRIDQAQRARFVESGAIGSHLENIQRGEGFKGFNQQTVSDIILRTDPRAELPEA